MNRKFNPWVSLVALLLAAVILVLTCTGCAPAAAAETEKDQARRFVIEYNQDGPGRGYIRIITDTETGVQYLVYADIRHGAGTAAGIGITALLPGEE